MGTVPRDKNKAFFAMASLRAYKNLSEFSSLTSKNEKPIFQLYKVKEESMKTKSYVTTDVVIRAAEKIRNRKPQDLRIHHPEIIKGISGKQIKEAFMKASRRLDSLNRASALGK
jgi:hypothetical protein